MNETFYVELGQFQKNHSGERICGDVFLSKRVSDQDRVLVVLSDGMGHGVKANVLATLTATMGLHFMEEYKDAKRIAELIMKVLPICSERCISYSTFTILDIHESGEITILEYDNPRTIIMRSQRVFDPQWTKVDLSETSNGERELYTCTFMGMKEDRIVFCSDGITQSGLGQDKYLLGWGREQLQDYIQELIRGERSISAGNLSQRVVNKAFSNDKFLPKDDISCGTIYLRDARKLMICTGPPIESEQDKVFADKFRYFNGKKIICGATTSDIISRELDLPINSNVEPSDPSLPPISIMEGADLVTEGALTLAKVVSILQTYQSNIRLGKGPADLIVKMMLESDEIVFLVGMRINQMHHVPTLPSEIQMRKNLILRIVELLENKFLKKTIIDLM